MICSELVVSFDVLSDMLDSCGLLGKVPGEHQYGHHWKHWLVRVSRVSVPNFKMTQHFRLLNAFNLD